MTGKPSSPSYAQPQKREKTNATSTTTNPTMAKQSNPIPLANYKVPSVTIQNTTSEKPQEFPQVQPQEKRMAISLTPKTENAATSPVRLKNTDTPWSNTSPASANLFVTWSSWPMHQAQKDITTATDGRSAPQPLLIYPTSLNSQAPTPHPKEHMCGPHCTICLQAASKKETDFDWEENSNRREERKPKINVATATQDTDYYPPSPKNISAQEQEEEERGRGLEYLNDKYGLDYYSLSESDFKSDHEYVTLV